MKNNTIIKWGEDVFQPKMCWIRGCNSQRLYWLVGFLNPFEKSACQIGSSSQRVEWTISSRTLDPGCCGGWHLRPKVERLDLVGYPRILQIFIHPWWFSRRISTINSTSHFVEASNPSGSPSSLYRCGVCIPFGHSFKTSFHKQVLSSTWPPAKTREIVRFSFFVYIRIIGLVDLVYLRLASTVLFCGVDASLMAS